MNKTKEMIVHFRRTRNKSNNISIVGEEVEVVEEYKYLGVHLDNRHMDGRYNTDAVHKKGQSRIYFLTKLRSLSVCNKMLYIFCKSVVESTIPNAVICWGAASEPVT